LHYRCTVYRVEFEIESGIRRLLESEIESDSMRLWPRAYRSVSATGRVWRTGDGKGRVECMH
jgi:hypothetical protein